MATHKVWIGPGIERERGVTLRANVKGSAAIETWSWSQLQREER